MLHLPDFLDTGFWVCYYSIVNECKQSQISNLAIACTFFFLFGAIFCQYTIFFGGLWAAVLFFVGVWRLRH